MEKQREMLKRGNEILSQYGIKTDIFMAPAHTYDLNTLKALQELGYCRMTDGFGVRPYEWYGITFYPISFLMSRSLKKKRGCTTLVIHTNEIDREGMEKYRKLFMEHRKDLVSYDSFYREKIRRRGIWGRCAEFFLAGLKRNLVKLKV